MMIEKARQASLENQGITNIDKSKSWSWHLKFLCKHNQQTSNTLLYLDLNFVLYIANRFDPVVVD